MWDQGGQPWPQWPLSQQQWMQSFQHQHDPGRCATSSSVTIFFFLFFTASCCAQLPFIYFFVHLALFFPPQAKWIGPPLHRHGLLRRSQRDQSSRSSSHSHSSRHRRRLPCSSHRLSSSSSKLFNPMDRKSQAWNQLHLPTMEAFRANHHLAECGSQVPVYSPLTVVPFAYCSYTCCTLIDTLCFP